MNERKNRGKFKTTHRISESGVSTIIATILMVAVTVILAGVLYVMVIGFGGGGDDNVTPLGSWHDVNVVSNTSAKLVFGSFSKEVRPVDLRLIISKENQTTNIILPAMPTGQDTNATVEGDNSTTIDAVYRDYGWQTGTVGAGDAVLITGLEPGARYTVVVFHLPTQSVISMVGAASTFRMYV